MHRSMFVHVCCALQQLIDDGFDELRIKRVVRPLAISIHVFLEVSVQVLEDKVQAWPVVLFNMLHAKKSAVKCIEENKCTASRQSHGFCRVAYVLLRNQKIEKESPT